MPKGLPNANINMKFNQFQQEKANVMKSVLHEWGEFLKEEIKRAERKAGRSNVIAPYIRYRVQTSKNRQGLITSVRLMVGILDKNSPALKYLRFYLYGTKPHFLPEVTKEGIRTGVLKWAWENNLLYIGQAKTGKTNPDRSRVEVRWKDGPLKGRIFYGIPNVSTKGKDTFSMVYQKYKRAIVDDILSIIGE